MLTTKDIVGFMTIGLLGMDTLFIAIALGVKNWIYLDNSTFTFYSGLWELCTEIKSSGNTVCLDIDDTPQVSALGLDYSDVEVVRAMMFLGLFLVVGGLACVIVKQFVLKDKKEILYAAAGVLFVAAVFLLTGWAFFHAQIYEGLKDAGLIVGVDDLELHAGFGLAVIAWILTSVGVGLCVAMALGTISQVNGVFPQSKDSP